MTGNVLLVLHNIKVLNDFFNLINELSLKYDIKNVCYLLLLYLKSF